MIKVVFVDIDNTLLDFDLYVKKTLEKGFNLFNLAKYNDSMYEVFKRNNDQLWRKIEEGELTFEGLKKIRFNIIFKELGIDYDGEKFEMFFRKELNESANVIDGAIFMLEDLKKKYILATASNGPYDQQVHRLEIGGLAKYFDYFFVSSKVGYQKPLKEFFINALNEINENENSNINFDECLIIGDSLTSDIEGGFRVGMKTCFYSHHKELINDSRINYFSLNLKDIPRIINE